MKTLSDISRALLRYAPNTLPNRGPCAPAGWIQRGPLSQNVAAVDRECEHLGPTLAAAPAMKIALEAILEWDRDDAAGLPDDVYLLAQAALGLAETRHKNTRNTRDTQLQGENDAVCSNATCPDGADAKDRGQLG